VEPYVFDANGWATGAISPLPTAQSFSLLAPEPSPRIDAGRWAHQARTSLRAVLELAQPKRYPSATMPLADAVHVTVVHLDAVETARPTQVLVLTLPLDRAPAVRAAAVAGAEAIGGAGFDVLVTRGQRLWQVSDAVEEGGDRRAPLAVAAMLAAVYLAPIVPPGGGTIFGLKTARQRLEALGWRT
jgi:hypothetical protein